MIIGSLLRYGGTEKHFLQLAEGLDEHFNFIIFHLNPRKGKAYDLLSERTQIYNLNYTGSFFGTAKSIINAYQILKTEKPNLIYSSSLIGLILILPFSIIYRAPIISARRSLYSKSVFKWSSWIKKIIFWINNIASTRIIGNSEAVGQLTYKDAFSKTKYITINNGLDLKDFSKIDQNAVKKFRQEFNLKKDNFIIGSVGNYREVKNHKQIIKAAKHISNVEEKIKFIIVGEGVERKKMEDMIRLYNLEDTLFLTGYRSDLAMVLSIMDVFVMTSTSEGSPNAMIEACATSKLIIGTDVPSINEIIEHKKNGFLVPLYDDQVLADLIIKLYEDFEYLGEVREEAYKTVIDDYNISKNLEKFHKVFSEVINTK